MNRQQRRKMQREAKQRQEYWDKYEGEINHQQDRFNETSIKTFYLAFGLALHEKFGFGEKRIGRAIERTDEIMREIGNGNRTYFGMVKELQDKTGVYFDWQD